MHNPGLLAVHATIEKFPLEKGFAIAWDEDDVDMEYVGVLHWRYTIAVLH